MAAPMSAPPHKIRSCGIRTGRRPDDVSEQDSVTEAAGRGQQAARCKTAPPVRVSSAGTQGGDGADDKPPLVSRTLIRDPSGAEIPGAPPRKTINRSGRRTLIHTRGQTTHDQERRYETPSSDVTRSADHVSRTTAQSTDYMDFVGVATDIYTENGWDTDLEGEEDTEVPFNRPGKTIYLDSCKTKGVIPVSYFLRHMYDEELELKHHGLGPERMRPISVAMVSNTQVLRMSLADNWLGEEGGRYVCEMLKENCYITHLDLSDNRLDYTFADRLIDVLLNNNTVTHLTLSGNEFDDRAAVYLAEAITSTGRLEYLSLTRNHLSEVSGKLLGPAIAENTSIRVLDLSWNSLRRKGAVAIAQGIKGNVVLLRVDLSWNGFGNDGAKALGDALKANTTLEELDISNNRITTEGAVLLGKGLAVSECLRVLKMGKNPMQSSGCYSICAAISKNPNSVMELLDFSDIMINSDFKDVFSKLKEQLPDLRMRHGGDGVPKRPKARVHPMVKLQNYITKHNLKLLDFFNKFDSDGSMSVSREEFQEGIQETGLKLTNDEVQFLLDELDKDGDGEINYSELVMGHQDFTEKERKMGTTIMQYQR